MTLSNSEQKIQTRIKASLNSKMPSRFPLVLFFAPKELGGLGMISVSTHIIPDNDLKYKKNNQDIQQLNENEKPFNKWVPMAINFIKTWRIEFQESKWVWNEFMKHGKKYDITPYGTESMHVLRAEKGFIIVGQDTDGSVTPKDINMDWIVSKKKEDFLGKRSFSRSDTRRTDRKQLVGLLVNDKKTVLPEGSYVVDEAKPRPPMDMIGHVSSSYYSPTCDHPIALALIKNGLNRMGDVVKIPLMSGKVIDATITDSIFYDKEGARNNE